MFKNATIYRLQFPAGITSLILAAQLAQHTFTECGPTQEKSSGWVPPREAHGAMVESVAGQWIFRLMIETKGVPGSVLTKKAKERAQQIEQTTGRKPGKKETKELKEEIKQSLLPMAFSRVSATTGWYNPDTQLLVLDTASSSRADEFITALVKSADGLVISMLDTTTSPVAYMANALQHTDPTLFDLGSTCELKAADESKAVVRYNRHSLDLAEIKQHIAQGKLPSKLALSFSDRVSFVLTEGMRLTKIEFEDVAFENKSADDTGFDADVAIMTGELSLLIEALVDEMNGEKKAQEGASA